MLTAPWLKRIDFATGAKTSRALSAEAPFVLGPGEQVSFDGTSWFHVSSRGAQWLFHGSVVSEPTGLWVFMEYPEARHPELEAALPREPQAAAVYADWLEEQGDPFAAALKPELSRLRGPAGLWWMEGLERTGAVTWKLRDGFVRELEVTAQVYADQLQALLHRVCHLRACVALERLRIDPKVRGWAGWSSSVDWAQFQWPAPLAASAWVRGLRG